MAIGAGPLYTNAVMGQAPSASERDHVRKPSLWIDTRLDIDFQESEQPSRPESWSSLHFDRTDQAPYSSGVPDEMNTQTSLLNLPKGNPSRDLAFFLRTTGPTAPHRRPSKIGEQPKRTVTTPKNALRFFKLGQKRPSTPAFPPFEESTDELPPRPVHVPQRKLEFNDEGGLLSKKTMQIGKGPFVQEVSSAGQKYLAIVPKDDEARVQPYGKGQTQQRRTREFIPMVMDSQVSISYADSISSPEVYDTWMCAIANEHSPLRGTSPPRKSSAHLPLREESTLRVVNPSSPVIDAPAPAPIRRRASDHPSPEPLSAVSLADSHQSHLKEHPAKNSLDLSRALTSHPVHSTTTSLPLPNITLPHEAFPVRHLPLRKDMDIKHPSPRRFASHPVLLQRASSITSSLYPQSTSDSPGPPPRSPLRLRRHQRTIESAIADHTDRDPTPRPGLSCSEVGEYRSDVMPIKPTVTTSCTGPIKRPDSREKGCTSHAAQASSRKEREERIKTRKLRDKPAASRALDSLVSASPRGARQRLKKARPQICIPDLRPAPLNTRPSSTTSSNASYRKVSEFTRTPVSAVPSETTPISTTGYTSFSPTASSGSVVNEPRMTLSPVMLVAEEVPMPKAKSQQKPARLVMKEGKSYTPRPRSASLPRNAAKRRSINRSQASTRANSPAPAPQDDEAPPLPSPPPNRKLPPTPPASGSEKPRKSKALANLEAAKELPQTPMHWLASAPAQASGGAELPSATHSTQLQRRSGSSKATVDFDARLAALEHQNKLLSAALMAVLRTNGERNLPLAELASFDNSKTPAAWESRLARRKASDAASSSNGSALDMYMNTRRGSKNGF